MPVVRGPDPAENFFCVTNSFARDERLSLRARGVLLEILSHGPDWCPDASEMSTRAKEGRGAIYTAFAELEEAGYLVREKYQKPGGQWVTRTTFYLTPQNSDVPAGRTDYRFPEVGEPVIGSPEVGQPTVGEPVAIRSTETKNRTKNPPVSPRGAKPESAETPESGTLRSAAKRGTPLPEPFEVTDDMKAWVRDNCPGINGWAEHEKFCDFHRAKGSVFKKWDAAWRNWMRKAVEINSQNGGRARTGPAVSTTDQRVQQGLEVVERFRRKRLAAEAGTLKEIAK